MVMCNGRMQETVLRHLQIWLMCQENGYVCVNDESDYVADFVEFNHVCDEWEGKR